MDTAGLMKPQPLLGVQLLREFLQTVFATARVENAPCVVSTLLIALPGFGKTSIASGLAPEGTICVFDATGRGLSKLLESNKNVHHVVFNDLVAIMAHKASVNSLTLATINAMTEEGIATEAYPTETKNLGRKCGVVAAITPDILADGRRWWNASGLTTRLLPFSFRHSQDLQLKINDGIQNGVKYVEIPIPLPLIPVKVNISPQWKACVRLRAEGKGKDLNEEPIYRRHKQYQAMAMGHALVRTRNWRNPSVGKEDIEFLDRIFRHIHYLRCEAL